MSAKEHQEEGGGHGHESPFIQHHYDGAEHQFETGKLGIWLFLGQEVLFFSALFVAYIIYRHNHPEVFEYAHHYLDVKMGAINTGVLILSSLTAAWSVRAAQLAQRKLLVGCLAVTILCACGFLVIKYFEYSHKAHIGTVFGKRFQPTEAPDGTEIVGAPDPEAVMAPRGEVGGPAPGEAAPASDERGIGVLPGLEEQRQAGAVDTSAHALPPANTGMFFTIYFAMTGLHGIHVLAGVFVFIWLLVRAVKGHFTPRYYGPIDFAALYWHLVDLIWIFLFPLLYLIH
jgi:cytochrome c oxidase subunit 3